MTVTVKLLVLLVRNLAGTKATLSQASGTVSTSYLTIKDIAATGSATAST